MEQFLRYHKRMFILTSLVSLAAAIALAVLLPGDWARVFGFAVGAAAQLLKFGVLDVSTVRKIAAADRDAAKIQLRSTFLSFVVFAAAVAIVFAFSLDVWTMAAGIFLPRIILLADAFIRPNPFDDPPRRGEAADKSTNES